MLQGDFETSFRFRIIISKRLSKVTKNTVEEVKKLPLIVMYDSFAIYCYN